MPTIVVEPNDTHDSIIRPIVVTVMKDLEAITNFSNDVTHVFLGSTGSALQPGTPIAYTPTDDTAPPTSGRFTVEVTDDTSNEAVMTIAVERKEISPIFVDSKLGVLIKPVYAATVLELQIRGRFADRTSAVRWRNGLIRAAAQGRKVNTHKASYHYGVPQTMQLILCEIYRLREKQAGYSETLKTWMMDHFTDRITTLTNMAGNQPLLAVAETQTNIIGQFNFAAFPEMPEVDKETGTWQTAISYVIHFEKVISCVMRYPLMVHNTMLSKKWRPNSIPYHLEKEVDPRFSYSNANFEMSRSGWPGPERGIPGISYPFFDDWLPQHTFPFSVNLIRMLIQITPTDLRDILDLQALGDWELDEDLINYMTSRPEGLLALGNSAVKVSLYNATDPVENELLTIDGDLKLRSTEDLDLRAVYHVTIDLLYDLTILSGAAKTHLRENGELAIKLFTILYPNLAAEGLLPTLTSIGSIKEEDFFKITNIIKDFYILNHRFGKTTMQTVGDYTIAVRRSSNAPIS